MDNEVLSHAKALLCRELRASGMGFLGLCADRIERGETTFGEDVAIEAIAKAMVGMGAKP